LYDEMIQLTGGCPGAIYAVGTGTDEWMSSDDVACCGDQCG